MKELADAAMAEIARAVGATDPGSVERACAMIAEARRVMLYGSGREGLQMQGLAMRLHHLGLDVSMQGDMAAPPLGAGDLFVVSAGPGELSTVNALMDVARDAGASILFLTAEPDCPAAARADHVLAVPAQTMASDQGASASSVLPMGSVYEGALFVLFEIMVAMLKQRLGVSDEAMRANHTNME